MNLSREEFTYLKSIEKHFVTNEVIFLGPPPLKWEREIISIDKKENFFLNFYRGSIKLTKFSYNNNYRKVIILGRFCSEGRHTNPPDSDGKSFEGAHVHIFDERFGDKIAYPVTSMEIVETDQIENVLEKFLKFFNVPTMPSIQTSII